VWKWIREFASLFPQTQLNSSPTNALLRERERERKKTKHQNMTTTTLLFGGNVFLRGVPSALTMRRGRAAAAQFVFRVRRRRPKRFFFLPVGAGITSTLDARSSREAAKSHPPLPRKTRRRRQRRRQRRRTNPKRRRKRRRQRRRSQNRMKRPSCCCKRCKA